ncbi:hypothetical protein AVEN_74960-1 [Araneus ventricosus]|uniref:EGF-like domain-containing protein n=1 Tax=Araneus ventricosus TaxID=182803 RepID=A0A4Y2M4P9_ARAVE|nr:hypothetical protein AVEN_74960-1 [Araneus ventricosus]
MKFFLSFQKFQEDGIQVWAINYQQRKEKLFSRKIRSGAKKRLSSASIERGGLRRNRAHRVKGACDCGPDANCTWTTGWMPKKICSCKPGYAEQKEKCKACECGPDSNCTFSGWFHQKICICQPGYWEVNGKCVACSSVCKNGNCVNEDGKEICKCNPGYGNFKGTSCKGI